LSKEASELLDNYLWPGNVRELENTMHRAVLLSSGDEIEASSIILTDPTALRNPKPETQPTTVTPSYGGAGQTLAGMERNLIIDTLKHTFGNRTQAANLLGISIRTLRNKLKQYQEEGFDVPDANG